MPKLFVTNNVGECYDSEKRKRIRRPLNQKDKDHYADLLQQCANGNQSAFSKLYAESSGQLLAVSMRLLRTRQAGEDALQDAYIKIWNKASSFDGTKASAMTWMTTIVRNRCLDIIRAQKVRPQETDIEYEGIEFTDESLAPDDLSGLALTTRRMLKCMESLPEQQRQAILMAYYYGMTHIEIAKQLDSPLGTVKAWVRRGVMGIKECLE